MLKFCLAAALLLEATPVRAEELLPSAVGTVWQYDSTEEFGGPAAAPTVHSTITVRLGREKMDDKEFLKFETLAGDTLIKTELMTVDEHGIVCHARGGRDGKMAKLDPPEIILPVTLSKGDTWDTEGEVAGMQMHQHFTVVAEESVTVGAGRFRAFHLHCEESALLSTALDRWFASGTGFVKETTVVRGPSGAFLQRQTLELNKQPAVVVQPSPPSRADADEQKQLPTGPSIEVRPTDSGANAEPNERSSARGKKLLVEVSGDPAGGLTTEFPSDVPHIYVRWHGRGLPEGAKVRVAWIAEDVGDIVEPNFVVDETETAASAPDSSARFTLGRPPDGWAEGKYRLEFYVDGSLEETVKVTIKPLNSPPRSE
jgi:hypothetical protein